MTEQSINTPTEVEAEDSNHLQSWSSRWIESRIGFHKEDIHEFLLKHGESILSQNNSTPKRVLVPLCGKTVDLTYLAGHNAVEEVVGVEGITKAVLEFIDENPAVGISSKDPLNVGAFEKYTGDCIVLLKGNFFHLSEPSAGGKFDMIWDRGSLVAINPGDRETYTNTIANLINPGGSILVTTVDRTENNTDEPGVGPPFSIDESSIRSIYEQLDWVDKVEFLDQGDPDERHVIELCFRIVAKVS